jgi:hypothetical protein
VKLADVIRKIRKYAFQIKYSNFLQEEEEEKTVMKFILH